MTEPSHDLTRVSAADAARDAIRAAIAGGQYGPGDMLPSERVLAPTLGISRVTLRKALIALREEGYLVSGRGVLGGHRVTSLATPRAAARRRARNKPALFTETLEYRTAVECEAARLAALRAKRADLRAIRQAIAALRTAGNATAFRQADGAFHTGIAAASGNALLGRAIVETRSALFLLSGSLTHTILETTLNAHLLIADALARRDPDAAARAMRAHLEQAGEELLAV